MVLTLSALNASSILHDTMVYRVVRAPMAWLEQTPSGRIINRCAKDVDVMDGVLIRYYCRGKTKKIKGSDIELNVYGNAHLE